MIRHTNYLYTNHIVKRGTMSETIETVGNSLIKHGPGHDRAYLMKLHPTDVCAIIDKLEELACSRGYSKIFAKVPAREAGRFVAAGYHLEAAIPYFFPEEDSACFMAKYFQADRKLERQPLLVREVLIAADAQQRAVAAPLPAGFALRATRVGDAAKMAELYRRVYASKGFALHDPASIRAAMKGGAIFFGVWKGESLVALSCAVTDLTSSAAEMAEFATLPDCRDQGLTLHLLQQMEENMLTLGIRSVFGIARAYSFDINATFARNGYRFGGTLTNNLVISGSLESVNVWHKTLPDDPGFAWRHLFEADLTGSGGAAECPR